MKTRTKASRFIVAGLCTVVLSCFAGVAQAQSDCDKARSTTVGARQANPTYDGKPLSYWMELIQKRDQRMSAAFDALQALGPLAEAAVPLLDSIVAEGFVPIKIGQDPQEVVLAKLKDIQLRADAVDALAAIGPAAECSARTMIRWGITLRVIPLDLGGAEGHALFAEMVAVDILERMRVAGAIPELGRNALFRIVPLLSATDGEKRKLAVAILEARALPIAVALLKSMDCEEKKLGVTILTDMWPVLPAAHLFALPESFSCDPN